MIDWMDSMLRSWGHAKHRLMTSSEGAPQSIMGRIATYGPSAGESGHALQRFREGMTGDALLCSLAIHRAFMAGKLTDRQYEVGVFVFYACKGYTVRQKTRAMSLSTRGFYDLRDRAHENLAPFFSNQAVFYSKEREGPLTH